LALSYGRIAKIAAQLSNGLVNSAMGQIPCSTERISSFLNTFLLGAYVLLPALSNSKNICGVISKQSFLIVKVSIRSLLTLLVLVGLYLPTNDVWVGL